MKSIILHKVLFHNLIACFQQWVLRLAMKYFSGMHPPLPKLKVGSRGGRRHLVWPLIRRACREVKVIYKAIAGNSIFSWFDLMEIVHSNGPVQDRALRNQSKHFVSRYENSNSKWNSNSRPSVRTPSSLSKQYALWLHPFAKSLLSLFSRSMWNYRQKTMLRARYMLTEQLLLWELI